jgi:hypothetical protein
VCACGLASATGRRWRSRWYDTYVVAAPLNIGVQRYIGEAIIIHRPKTNKFYLHEVEIMEKPSTEFKTATEGSSARASRYWKK